MQSNVLMHYKYVKRVRGSNGKWRYFYDLNPNKRPSAPVVANRPVSRPKMITEGVPVQKRPIDDIPASSLTNRPRSREKFVTEGTATVQKRDTRSSEGALSSMLASFGSTLVKELKKKN